MRFDMYSRLIFLVLGGALVAIQESEAWTSSSSSARRLSHPSAQHRPSRLTLNAVSQSQTAFLDGSEWMSLQKVLMSEKKVASKRLTQVGYMTVVTGTAEDAKGDRVVGIQAPDDAEENSVVSLSSNCQIYKDSMAIIPKSTSDQVAINTLVASLTGVHCAIPQVEGVGGSEDGSKFVSGKVVVMGGSDYASFLADAIAALGASVHLVSTGKPKVKSKEIKVIPPSMGEMEIGFCAYIGQFDSLVDTMSDEGSRPADLMEDDDVEDDEEDYNTPAMSFRGGVLSELKRQHKCECYISTVCTSQQIVREQGLLFGPKQAENHLADTARVVLSNKPNSDYQAIVPPTDFGMTLQTLLDAGVTFKYDSKGKVLARGWALKDFWELTTWPRDSQGAGDTRFGLPTSEEFVSLSDPWIADPKSVKLEQFQEAEPAQQAPPNPFITDIVGVDGLQAEIISPEKDCLLFMSAPFCKTCRSLSPRYNRMARENDDESFMFAKADATGSAGKLLGKLLDVDAVPAFVLFRNGKTFGVPLSVSRLPSSKLDRAMESLSSGMEWDINILQEDDAEMR